MLRRSCNLKTRFCSDVSNHVSVEGVFCRLIMELISIWIDPALLNPSEIRIRNRDSYLKFVYQLHLVSTLRFYRINFVGNINSAESNEFFFFFYEKRISQLP
jgi:hypothetical protein